MPRGHRRKVRLHIVVEVEIDDHILFITFLINRWVIISLTWITPCSMLSMARLVVLTGASSIKLPAISRLFMILLAWRVGLVVGREQSVEWYPEQPPSLELVQTT